MTLLGAQGHTFTQNHQIVGITGNKSHVKCQLANDIRRSLIHGRERPFASLFLLLQQQQPVAFLTVFASWRPYQP